MNIAQLILASIFIVLLASQTCPYGQYFQFVSKTNIHPYPIIPNPYHNPSSDYLQKVKENLNNKERVCALKYTTPDRQNYSLKNFNTRQQAEQSGWIVTHQGICGKCSTTKDLFVYLTQDLTRPVRKCGLKSCIKKLGFTDACTEVWLWNTLNTKKKCGGVCIWSLIIHQKFVIDGHLNKCLQCDEDISGPIFKYESGRTRRNSGIKSEIDRPSDQVYNLTHCYY